MSSAIAERWPGAGGLDRPADIVFGVRAFRMLPVNLGFMRIPKRIGYRHPRDGMAMDEDRIGPMNRCRGEGSCRSVDMSMQDAFGGLHFIRHALDYPMHGQYYGVYADAAKIFWLLASTITNVETSRYNYP